MENKTTLYGYTYEYLTRVFNEYKNENGSIDEDNLQLLVKQEFNKKLEKAEVKRLMLQIDQDGNGIFYCNGGSVSIWVKKENIYN